MNVVKTKWLALSLIFAALASQAADVRVSGGGNALQKAVGKAKAGDVLLVEPGTYSAFDTQGKEIEIRSTKGPKRTFVAGPYLKKGYFDASSTIVAFGVPDAFAKGIAEGALVPSGDELVRKVSKTKVVGFTFDFAKTATSPRSHVVGGHIVGCILKNTSTLFSAVESCLIINTDYTKVMCTDSRLVNCTVIAGTHVADEEAIFCCDLFNTIVYDVNRGGGSPIIIGWGGTTRPQMLNSLFCDGIFWDCAVGEVDDSRMLRTDPGFVDVASGDYRLSANSPCVDTGNNAYLTAGSDLNGGTRIVNGRVDIGAYEYGSTPPAEEEEDDPEPTPVDPEPSEEPSVEVSCALDGEELVLGGDVFEPVEIVCTACKVKSVKVTGLPNGLKLLSGKKAEPYDYAIAGNPKKASEKPFAVKIAVQVTADDKKVKVPPQVSELSVSVLPLDAWVVGTFSGIAEIEGETGTLTLTVKNTGAISGKVTIGKKAHSFKANGFEFVSEDGYRVCAELPKLDAFLDFDLQPKEFGDDMVGLADNNGVNVGQGIWKLSSYKKFLKAYTSPDKEISWTTAGKVTWQKTVEGSKKPRKLTATLLPLSTDEDETCLYAYFVDGDEVTRLDVTIPADGSEPSYTLTEL